MKTKILLFSVFTITLLAIGTVITVLFNTAPETKDVIWLFYTATFFFLSGLAFLVMYLVSYLRFRLTPAAQTIANSLRYSALFGLCVIALIALGANNSLNWLIGLIVIGAMVIADLLWRRRTPFKVKKS